MKHAELLDALKKHTKTPRLKWEDSSAEHGWTCQLPIVCEDGELFFNVGFPENSEEGVVVTFSVTDDCGETLSAGDFPATDKDIALLCESIDQTERAVSGE